MKWTWIERALALMLGVLLVLVLGAWSVPPAASADTIPDEDACGWLYVTTVYEWQTEVSALTDRLDEAEANVARLERKAARQAATIARLRDRLGRR